MSPQPNPSEYCRLALERLSHPDVEEIEAVLGTVLRHRCRRTDPKCALLDQLSSDQNHLLKLWHAACSGYLCYLIDPQTGAMKAEDDLMGRAKSCSQEEFDRYLGDFYAEMAAVRELGGAGYSEFDAVLARHGVKTVDYRARFGSDKVCVEVKNVRAPIMIVDAFAAEIRARYGAYPSLYPFRVVLTYFSDNTVTQTQWQEIASYVKNLEGRTAPFEDKLVLSGSLEIKIRVEPGLGEACMVRYGGFDYHGEVSLTGFLHKVDSQTRAAMLQFATEPDSGPILVFNINPPTGLLWSDFLNAAVERVAELSGGGIRCEFLLEGHRLAPEDFSSTRAEVAKGEGLLEGTEP